MSTQKSKDTSSNGGCFTAIAITALFGFLMYVFADFDKKTDRMSNASWLVCSALFIGYIFAITKYVGQSYQSIPDEKPPSPKAKPSLQKDYRELDREIREHERKMKEEEEWRIQSDASNYDPHDHIDFDESDLR